FTVMTLTRPSRSTVTLSLTPAPATFTELQGLAADQYASGLLSSKTGMPGVDGTVTATPLRWNVTVSVLCRPNVASYGWRRVPSRAPSRQTNRVGRGATRTARHG